MDKLYTFFNILLEAVFQTENRYLNIAVKIIASGAGTFIGWMVIKFILSFFEKRIKELKFIQIKGELFKIIRKAALYGLMLILSSYIVNLFDAILLEKIIYAVFIICFAGPVNEISKILFKYLEKNIASKTESNVDNIIFDLLNKFAGAIIFFAAVIMAMDILGINVMPFIAGAGVAGLALGFAAKDTLSNLIAGILLIIDRPFEIGDRIEVWSAPAGSATWGDVIDIGLRATKIKTTDNIIIIIPNNEIMMRDIINYTIISTKIRVRVDIGVSYDADIKKTKDIILKVAHTLPWISKDTPPVVVVRNFGESSVDLQLRIWIDNARKRMDTISFITDNLKDAFDKEGIEIPYPKRDITIVRKKD